MRKKILALMSVILATVTCAACASATTSNMEAMSAMKADGIYNAGISADMKYFENEGSKTEVLETPQVQKEEKLVYTCNTVIETKTFPETYDRIKKLIAEYEGFIQNESQNDNAYDWYYSSYQKDSATLNANIECRIPSAGYSDFVEKLSEPDTESKIVSKSTNVENITQEYYDNRTRIEALKLQEERLLKMMEEASTIEEMIRVEDRLTEVQYELNGYQTKLNTMDTDAAYSYVNITLREVKEYSKGAEESTFFTRMREQIKDAMRMTGNILEGILGLIIHLIPVALFVLLPAAAAIVLAIKLMSWIDKKRRK